MTVPTNPSPDLATPSATASAPLLTSTSSRLTQVLGIGWAISVVLVVCAAFWWSEPDATQGELVRLFYLHVPLAILEYVPFLLCGIGSVLFLWKRSEWGDLMAHAGAEVGVVMCALTLVTGAVWGRPTWGTYWDWSDVRLVTTLILCLLFVGYLALRRVPGDPTTRAKQAAIVALVALIDIPLINRSVEWWENRTLHQKGTIAQGKIEDINAFATLLGFIMVGLGIAFLMTHRFRIAWLERQVDRVGLDDAIAHRRAEAATGVDASVGRTPEEGGQQ